MAEHHSRLPAYKPQVQPHIVHEIRPSGRTANILVPVDIVAQYSECQIGPVGGTSGSPPPPCWVPDHSSTMAQRVIKRTHNAQMMRQYPSLEDLDERSCHSRRHDSKTTTIRPISGISALGFSLANDKQVSGPRHGMHQNSLWRLVGATRP